MSTTDDMIRDYMRAGISEGVTLRNIRPIADALRTVTTDEFGQPVRDCFSCDRVGCTGCPAARPSWDSWALSRASVVATRADCTRSQVGAVILSADHRVLSVGYNGLPAGIPGCATAGNCPRGQLSTEECQRDSDYSNCAATHAEANAINYADARQLPYATLYVTRRPCPACQTLINAAGIARVVTPEGEMK